MAVAALAGFKRLETREAIAAVDGIKKAGVRRAAKFQVRAYLTLFFSGQHFASFTIICRLAPIIHYFFNGTLRYKPNLHTWQ